MHTQYCCIYSCILIQLIMGQSFSHSSSCTSLLWWNLIVNAPFTRGHDLWGCPGDADYFVHWEGSQTILVGRGGNYRVSGASRVCRGVQLSFLALARLFWTAQNGRGAAGESIDRCNNLINVLGVRQPRHTIVTNISWSGRHCKDLGGILSWSPHYSSWTGIMRHTILMWMSNN